MDKGGTKWGSQSEAMWKDVQDNDLKAGLISATRPVDEYFSSRFEAQSNEFDAEAIRRQAKGFNEEMIRFTKTK
jgi:hypothetical protein